VTTAKLADDAVTTVKITDVNVTGDCWFVLGRSMGITGQLQSLGNAVDRRAQRTRRAPLSAE
ncbi:MAG: hypothetical protein OSB26_11945, partial [Woeseiaceae bacterium]|nr:hypothetical protein [Woeseiaceae bacterium]